METYTGEGPAKAPGEQSCITVSQDEGKRMNQFEVLIMSEAGKPIYTHSKREDSVTLMPLCCSLLSYAKRAQNEPLLTIKTSDELIINFSTRSPLIIVLIHYTNAYIDPVILIDQIEAQMISILTGNTLRSVFEERPTYDLKKLIYGSEKLIDSLLNLEIHMTQRDWPRVQTFLAVTQTESKTSSINNSQVVASSSKTEASSNPTNAAGHAYRLLIPIVAMPPNTRDSLHHILSTVISSNCKNVVFSLLFKVIGPSGYCHDYESQEANDELETDLDRVVNGVVEADEAIEQAPGGSDDGDTRLDYVVFQLMTVCNHHARHKITLADIHLVHALLNGIRSQLEGVDFLWMPVCLPRFNKDAFLHTYMSFTNRRNNCLVIFSVDREEFSNCQQAKTIIEERVEKLLKDSNQRNKLNYKFSPLIDSYLLELQVKLQNCVLDEQELAKTKQLTLSYSSKPEHYFGRQLQFLWYQSKKQVLWWQRSKEKPINPVLYHVMKKMFKSSLKTLKVKHTDESTFFAWHVPTYQLYTQFDSGTTTSEANEVVHKITSWIKKEEDNFSIKEYKDNCD